MASEQSNATVLWLPVGRGWVPPVRAEFDALLEAAVGAAAAAALEPAGDEPQVLEAVAGVKAADPDLLGLVALHGGSARQLVLAAAKADRPVVVWCHDDSHSLASAALACEGMRQLRLPVALLHGRAGTELRNATRAAAAHGRLRRARIGKLGATHHNLISADVAPLLLTERFGTWVVPLAESGLRERLAQVAAVRIDAELAAVTAACDVDVDVPLLRRAAALSLALADLAAAQALDALAVDCWSGVVPAHGVSPCLRFASRGPLIACEGDLVLAATMLAGLAITGSPGYVGDFYALDETDGQAVLMHCAGYACLHDTVRAPLPRLAARRPPGSAAAAGTVVACQPLLPGGPGTLVLLHGRRLDRLQILDCRIMETDQQDQMRVVVRLREDPVAVRRALAGNHYVLFPGSSAAAWRQWARWSGVCAGADAAGRRPQSDGV